MEIDEMSADRDRKAYEDCCIELNAIERKLDNGNLSPTKRKRLLSRQEDLVGRIIPNFLIRIQANTSSVRPLWDDF